MTDISNLDDAAEALLSELGEEAEPAEKPKKGKKPVVGNKTAFTKWWTNYGSEIDKSYRPAAFKTVIQTGLLPLDLGMEVGGIPMGGIMSLYGAEGGGKSTMWQFVVGKAQQQIKDLIVFIVDAEGRFNPEIALRNGMNLNKSLFDSHRMLYINPTMNMVSYEGVMKRLRELLIAADAPVICIIDSVDSLSTTSELAMDLEDGGVKYGGMARAHSVLLKAVAPYLLQNDGLLIMVHQLRDRIGGMIPGLTDFAGGRAVRHNASIRMKITPTTAITKGSGADQRVTGRHVKVSIERNSYATPEHKFEYDFRYDDTATFTGGPDIPGGLLDIACDLGLVTKAEKGGKYTFNCWTSDAGEPMVMTGRDAVRKWLIEHVLQAEELKALIYAELGATEE